MKLPIYHDDGFIVDADGNIICQFWNKREEDFDSAKQNAESICEAVNTGFDKNKRIEEMESILEDTIFEVKRTITPDLRERIDGILNNNKTEQK